MYKEIISYKELLEELNKNEKSYVLIYKKGSEHSDCAYNNLIKVKQLPNNTNIYFIDVNHTKDIHSKYNITTAPTLIEFHKDTPKNITKGCQDINFYKNMINNNHYTVVVSKEKPKNVTVYSTPTCHHCTTLKNHLRSNGIKFRDIDISKDAQKAQDLVKRTGQQGVPQTNINGQFIIGFDKTRINTLLGIK